jgi:hypothetical protein
MKKTLAVVATVLTLAGCCTQNFPLNQERMPTVPTYEGTNHFIFWGLGQEKTVNPKDVCGKKKITAVNTHYSFVQGLLTAITYGIYSPRGYSVYCEQD